MQRNRPAMFKERHFESEIIVRCVRWCLRFGLSFRNLKGLMPERDLNVDHDDLALGTALRARTEPPLPPRAAAGYLN